jgi:hypothetical protein
MYNGYRGSFLGVKRLGRGVDHQFPSSAKAEEGVDLPSVPALAYYGVTFNLLKPSCNFTDRQVED